VYGLGATLYHLITGHAPFTSKISDFLKKVERGEFKRPREIRQDVPRALEAICLKAMATQPLERYESAFQLAEDIEHWLADEPVMAWSEPPTVRIRRWIRRHSALVGSVTTAACVGLVVVGVSFVLLKGAYQREQVSHARVRHVVDDYFTQVSQATLLNQPGAQALRRELLEKAAEHYSQFLREHGDETNAALQVELAKAHFRLGVIRESLDSPSNALADLEAAETMQRRLVAESPINLERHYDLGMTLNAQGRLLHKKERFDVAVKTFQDALVVREHLVTMRPDDVEYIRTLANSHMNLGETWRKQGKYDRAVLEFGTAHSLRTTALEQSPNNAALLRDSAKGHYNLGNLQLERDQPGEAETSFRDAVALFEQLRQESPGGLELLELTAQAYRRLGDLQQMRQAFDEAMASYEHAALVSQVLYHQNPGVRQYRETYAAILFNRAVMNVERGFTDDAVAGYERARDLFVTLVEEFPEETPYQEDYAAVAGDLGELLLTLERPTEAMQVLSAALETIKIPIGGVSNRCNLILSKLSFNLGRSNWCLGDSRLAHQLFDDARDRIGLVLENEPARQNREDQLAEVAIELYALCLAAMAQESSGVQRDDWEQTMQLLRSELTSAESEAWLAQQTAGHLRAMARLQWTVKRLEAALNTMEISIAQWQQVIDAPDSERWTDERDETLGDLAALLSNLAEVQRENSPVEARESLERAKALLVQLVARHPDDEFYRKHLQVAEYLLQGLSTPK
jgi:tetratricopeptide (TPR) repeat protein